MRRKRKSKYTPTGLLRTVLCNHCDQRFVPKDWRFNNHECEFCGQITGPPLTKRDVKKEAWGFFADFIKLRDSKWIGGTLQSNCCTCNKLLAYGESTTQAGHWLAGRNKGILFDERCVHSQCRSCNYSMDGNLGGVNEKYYLFMIERYGHDVMEQIIDAKLKSIASIDGWTIEELVAIRDKYKLLAQQRKTELGLTT